MLGFRRGLCLGANSLRGGYNYKPTLQIWPRQFSLCMRCSAKSKKTDLVGHLQAKIRFTGPITVAEYMKEVLTNPVAGYYMHKDVFGSKGDFTTSPEISQMFGELIGVWCVNEWMQHGSPDHLQLVELGPGRGTLTDDILRAFSQFPELKEVSVHLVEVSPKLSEMQAEKLSGETASPGEPAAAAPAPESDSAHKCYNVCQSRYGPPVHWYRQLKDVPREFSFYVAHEFFDALPIHKFQKQDGQWREVLVDLDDSESGPHHLRLVLAPTHTPASSLLLKVSDAETRDHIELCPEGGAVISEIAERIAADGGFALIGDYGHTGEKTDTFRAFKQHELHDPLCEPGTADLTADVDFSYLDRTVQNEVVTYGPITQATFLHNMGIRYRLKALLEQATQEQRKDLVSGFDMLTNTEKMGERFKFFAMLHPAVKDYTPSGFTEVT